MLWPLIRTTVSDELDVEELTSFTTNPEHKYKTHTSRIHKAFIFQITLSNITNTTVFIYLFTLAYFFKYYADVNILQLKRSQISNPQ